MKIEITCQECGKKFKVSPHRIKAGVKYCSRQCYAIAKSKQLKGKPCENMNKVSPTNNRLRIGIHCKVCGKLMTLHLVHYLEGQKTCSMRCRNIAKRKLADRVCRHCNKKFRPPGGRQVFCSRECWRQHKRKQMQLVKFKCQYCGKEKYLEKKKDNAYTHWLDGKPLLRKYCNKKCADMAREGITGEGIGNWQGGKTSLQDTIRKSNAYIRNRYTCFKRDNWKSVLSGQNGQLRHHHLMSYSILFNIYDIKKNNWNDFYDILFDLDNVVTMTTQEHRDFHHKYGKVTTPEQFEEFRQAYIN